jgi:hypothetical protein
MAARMISPCIFFRGTKLESKKDSRRGQSSYSMHAVVAGKCTNSSRICEAFTTLSATDEQDFVALLVALVSGWVEPCHESEANDAHLLFLSFFMSCVLSGKSKII